MKNQTGSVLTEVMIAFVLVVLAIVMFTPLFAVGIKVSKNPKERTVATNLARQMIEYIQTKGFNDTYGFVNESIKINQDQPCTAANNNCTFTAPGDMNGQTLYMHSREALISTEDCTGKKNDCKPLQITRIYTFDQGTDLISPVDDQINVTVKITWAGRKDGGITMNARLIRNQL